MSDFFDIKNHVLNILNALNVPIGRLSFNRGTPNYYHPQRSAVISLGPKVVLGRLGEIHPTILEQFDLKGRAYSFSIFPENIPFGSSKSTSKQALEIYDLPSASRDFAFIVDEKVEIDLLIASIYSVDKNLIQQVSLFDVFHGVKANEQFGNGKKIDRFFGEISTAKGDP